MADNNAPYAAPIVPDFADLAAVRKFMEEELEKVSAAFVEGIAVDLRPIFAPPGRPRVGTVVYADGTSWNPGAGEGLYEFRSDAAWHKL